MTIVTRKASGTRSLLHHGPNPCLNISDLVQFFSAESHLFPHLYQFARYHRLPSLVVLTGLLAVWGCALFPDEESRLSVGSKRSLLQPLQTSPDAIVLEIFFVERPADDALLANEIWKEIDEHGDLTLDTLDNLHQNGFRIGHFSSNPPPPSIQKLIGMVAEISAEASDYTQKLMGRHTWLPPGVETEIATGIERGHCEFQLEGKDGSKTLEYDKVNCVFRMKAQRLQDGWVSVDFQPEIHHGDRLLRRVPSEQGFVQRSGQIIDPLLAQRFSVKMNVGETMLLTSMANDEGSLGDRFFCQDIGGTNTQRLLKKQRVLLIRVVDSGKPQPSFSK
jgi:hypothetical protein